MLRMGDWIEVKFWCNLLVSIANLLFLIGFVCMNWADLEFIEIKLIVLWFYYNELDSKWLELSLKYLEITFVVIWHYRNETELNWIQFMFPKTQKQGTETSTTLLDVKVTIQNKTLLKYSVFAVCSVLKWQFVWCKIILIPLCYWCLFLSLINQSQSALCRSQVA